ncbi:MAG TPA: glycosyltransferase family 4 protein [Gemmatimonadaceae bacterium]|nr:glycosyltransferase family 4 protein [Gemmatimonadaceae bacterium]
MRVLEVARQFYPKVGGIESCVLNVSRGLAQRGHTVEVVTLERDLQTGEKLGERSETVDSIRIHRIPHLGSSRYTFAPSWLRFTRDFDVVHIHAIDFFVDSAAFARMVGLLRPSIVVTTHGGIFHTASLRRLKEFYWKNVLRHTLKAATTVVAVSDSDADLVAPIVPPEKLVTIPNGIDPLFREAGLQHQTQTAPPRIVAFGRVSAAKYINRFLSAFATVAGQFPDVEVVVAGPDDRGTTEHLRRSSVAMGLAGRVHFPGPLPAAQLAELVATSRLFVSAAQHEGFGITTVEALSAGVPVMVTHTGIHDQLVNPGVNGWFWSGLPDIPALMTLGEALSLPDARLNEMRRAARDSAAPFDWSLSTDRYERVLESAYRQSAR